MDLREDWPMYLAMVVVIFIVAAIGFGMYAAEIQKGKVCVDAGYDSVVYWDGQYRCAKDGVIDMSKVLLVSNSSYQLLSISDANRGV